MAAYKRRVNSRKGLPEVPGLYYWSEYRQIVSVYMRGKSLYVMPPMSVSIEVKITPNIAGKFRKEF